MSRAKAKIAVLHDMQSRYSDVILTKKDCDMIKKALLETYNWSEIRHIYIHLNKLNQLGKDNGYY